MNSNLKLTYSKTDILQKIKNYNDEIIDLSAMNLFEATKIIMMISTYGACKNSNKKFKYKVSAPNIQNILKEIPLNQRIELIF